MKNLKNKSIKGFLWDFIGKFFLQGIGFIVSIFLARLLSPEEFGLIGMVMVIITITQVFIDIGLGSALIQKKEVNNNLYSSVFWLNIFFGGALTILLYFSADSIANFYHRDELSLLVKILSSIFILSSFGIVQTLQFTKRLDFKTHSIISIITSILSGIIGIILAYIGYGVWALVYQKIAAVVLSVISYWIVSKWRPILHFSMKDIKSIWGFSSNQFMDGILSSIFQKLDIIMIGKMFQASALGYYTRAQSLDTMVNTFSSGSLKRVFFPMISKIQDDLPKVRDVYKKSILLAAFVGVGLTSFLFLVADDLFIILFTEKWNYSAKLFKLMAVIGFTYPISSIIVTLIVGLGHSRKNLILGIWKKLIGLVALYIGYLWGIEAFLYACIGRNLTGISLNMLYAQKVINIKLITQYTWLIKPLLFAAILVVGIEFSIHINNIYLSFLTKGSTFCAGYFILSYLLDKELSFLIRNQLNNLAKYVRNRNS